MLSGEVRTDDLTHGLGFAPVLDPEVPIGGRVVDLHPGGFR